MTGAAERTVPPRVTVAILNVGVHPRIEHVLRALTVRPCEAIIEILGVGDTSPFPAGVRRVAAADCRAAAKNAALQAAKGDFVLLLAADTVAPPATVEGLAAVMQRHPRCALAGARILYENGRPRPCSRRFPPLGRELALSTPLWLRWLWLRAWLRRGGGGDSGPVD